MRNRILGQSSSAVYEKYYHDNFINCDIQSMVLLRPSQNHLIQAASQMNKDRDPLAPTGLNDAHREEIRNTKYLCRLRLERNALSIEIKSKYGSISKAKHTEIWQQRSQKGKQIDKIRAAYRREKLEAVKDDYHKQMPTMEIEKQLERMARKKLDAEDRKLDQDDSDSDDDDDNDDNDEGWEPPIPDYRFPERSRLAEAFFGPDAETMTRAAALARRIQVINDLAALCKLRKPPCRQKPFNWNKADPETKSGTDKTGKMDVDGR